MRSLMADLLPFTLKAALTQSKNKTSYSEITS